MAGIKISALPAIPVAPQLTDIFPEVQPASGGTTYKTTFQQLYTLFSTTSGTVNAGTINQLAYYAASGNAVSGLATGNNGVLVTSNSGVPSISSTLPSTVQGNITTLGAQAAALNMNSHQINNVSTPTASTDACTKGYADNIAAGLNPIEGVYAASTANLAGYTYANGTAGVGATLTAGSTGVFTVDGVSPPVGSRFLYKDDSTYSGVANGIYVVTTSSGGSAAVLTRAADYNSPSNINPGDLVSVTLGTVNAGSTYYETATIVAVGTTPIAFSVFFSPASYLKVANNLSDLANIVTAKGNLNVTSFTAHLTADITNATGDGTQYVIVFNNLDSSTPLVQTAFDPTTGIYTAPYTGLYVFNAIVVYLTPGAATSSFTEFLVNAVDYLIASSAPLDGTVNGSIIVHLTAGDTVKVNASASGTTKTVGFNKDYCRFSGYFMG